MFVRPKMRIGEWRRRIDIKSIQKYLSYDTNWVQSLISLIRIKDFLSKGLGSTVSRCTIWTFGLDKTVIVICRWKAGRWVRVKITLSYFLSHSSSHSCNAKTWLPSKFASTYRNNVAKQIKCRDVNYQCHGWRFHVFSQLSENIKRKYCDV